MATFTDDALGLSFELPDKLTVRQRLRFKSAVLMSGAGDVYTRAWEGALTILGKWECETVPDPHALDVDADTRPEAAAVVEFVANAVTQHLNELSDVPKNA